MKLIINFSARQDGNCGDIARYIAGAGDRIVHYADLHAHACAGCAYECFSGDCRYRDDGVYALYDSMARYDRVILIVPMYGGNPASLYFAFCERGQSFFRTEEKYQGVVERLYIIGVYGSQSESLDFIPCLEKWFTGTAYTGRVLDLERHVYGQKMGDRLLELADVCNKIERFLA